jgi:hypothetical protein
MGIQEVIRVIDESGAHAPFIITFFKADGVIRDMLCLKRNKSRIPGGAAVEGSAFKYSIKQKNVLLINELPGYSTSLEKTEIGTHIKLPEIDLNNVRISAHSQIPKSIKLFAIRSFNGQQVIHE